MIHPTTGLPITSHQAALIDMSNYKGKQNVRIVRQKGQAYKAKVIEGIVIQFNGCAIDARKILPGEGRSCLNRGSGFFVF